jgi:hypothetical protein
VQCPRGGLDPQLEAWQRAAGNCKDYFKKMKQRSRFGKVKIHHGERKGKTKATTDEHG